jgi:NACHT domain- and WD repeat-containing protein
MFDKGIYLSEVASKSAQYCFPSYKSPYGILLVCEVALGKQLILQKANFSAKQSCLRLGFDSVKGAGRHGPSQGTAYYLPDGVRVCMGPNAYDDDYVQGDLLYSEHVVYDTSRVRIKYVLKLKFNYFCSPVYTGSGFTARVALNWAISANHLPMIIQMISSAKDFKCIIDDDIALQAAQFIRNVTKSPEFTHDERLMARLVKALLVYSNNDEIELLLLDTIECLLLTGRQTLECAADNSYFLSLLKAGGVQAMDVVRRKQPQINALRANSILDAIVIPTMARLMIVNDDVLAIVWHAINCVCKGSDYGRDFVLMHVPFERFHEVFSSDSDELISCALRVVSNLVSGNELQIDRVIQAGMLIHLRQRISGKNTTHRKESCAALLQVSAGTSSQIAALVACDVIPLLLQVVRREKGSEEEEEEVDNEDIPVKKMAITVVANVAKFLAETSDIAYLMKSCCIEPLIDFLRNFQENCRASLATLEAVKSILKTISNSDHPYAAIFHSLQPQLENKSLVDAIKQLVSEVHGLESFKLSGGQACSFESGSKGSNSQREEAHSGDPSPTKGCVDAQRSGCEGHDSVCLSDLNSRHKDGDPIDGSDVADVEEAVANGTPASFGARLSQCTREGDISSDDDDMLGAEAKLDETCELSGGQACSFESGSKGSNSQREEAHSGDPSPTKGCVDAQRSGCEGHDSVCLSDLNSRHKDGDPIDGSDVADVEEAVANGTPASFGARLSQCTREGDISSDDDDMLGAEAKLDETCELSGGQACSFESGSKGSNSQREEAHSGDPSPTKGGVDAQRSGCEGHDSVCLSDLNSRHKDGDPIDGSDVAGVAETVADASQNALFVRSVKLHDIRRLKKMLDAGFAINCCPEALTTAIKSRSLKCFKLMIDHGADLSLADATGNSCLEIAAALGRVKLLEAMFTKLRTESCFTTNLSKILCVAAKNGLVQCVKAIIDAKADVNQCDLSGRSAGHYAAERGHAKCFEMLMHAGLNVNELDSSGRCALQLSLDNLSIECFKRCLASTLPSLVSSSLKLSCMRGQCMVLCAFQVAGVNLADFHRLTDRMPGYETTHQKRRVEETPEAISLLNFVFAGMSCDEEQRNSTRFMHRDKNGTDVTEDVSNRNCNCRPIFDLQYSECVCLMVTAGCNINECDSDGCSFLLRATERGLVDTVRVLCTYGGDVNICSRAGRSPLLAAADKGFLDCIDVLLAARADINHCDNDGRSSVLLSSESGHSDCLIKLLDAGGRTNQIDRLGRSPLSAAVMRLARFGQSTHQDACVSSLLRHGARIQSVSDYINSVEASSFCQKDRALFTTLASLCQELSVLELKPSRHKLLRDRNVVSASIRGNMNLCVLSRHQFRKKILRFFVSSTFDDTAEERRVLLSTVMPIVQQRAQQLGFDVILSEMRFGIRDNNDHKALEICISELVRCFDDSVGLSYFLICGDKYGFRPAPRRIPESEMRKLLNHMNHADQSLVMELYQLDENFIHSDGSPASEYVLQHAAASNSAAFTGAKAHSDVFWTKYPSLVTALRKAATLEWPGSVNDIDNAQSSHPIKRYFISITETEAFHGLFSLKDSEIKEKCLVMKRSLLCHNGMSIRQMTPSSPKLKDFVDVSEGKIDLYAEDRLRVFHKNVQKVTNHLNSKFYMQYSPLTWIDGKGIDPSDDFHESYLKAFAIDSINALTSSLLKSHELMNQESNDLMDECFHHIMYAHDKFVPYERTTVTSEAFRAIQSYILCHGSCGHIFVLHGQSGCGKTFLMSQAITLAARETEIAGHVVIARFLGTSASSSSISHVLRSVCNQIHAIVGSDPPPLEFESLKHYFISKLSSWHHGRLIMFIDSLDQLDDLNGGRQLHWLPVSGLSSNVRLIVSTADDNVAPLNGNPFKCLSILKSKFRQKFGRIANRSEMVDVPHLNSLSSLVLDIMRHNMRRLTPLQASEIDKSFGGSVHLRTPLVACILANLFMDLPSSALNLPVILLGVPQSRDLHIRDIITGMFANLEIRHGKLLVTYVLSYLTLAKDGIAESELAEVLSLNDDVLADIYQWWVTPVRTMPASPLTMLLSDLSPYLSRRGCSVGGTELLFWYHQQFSEAVRFHYLNDASFVKSIHSLLADFFCGVWNGREKPYNAALIDAVNKKFPGETQGNRLVRQQPICFGDTVGIWSCGSDLSSLNSRRCSEAVFHLLSAERFDDAAIELCDINSICARIMCGHGSELVHYLQKLRDNSSLFMSNQLVNVTTDYLFWIKRDISALMLSPTKDILPSCSRLPSSSFVKQAFLKNIWPWICQSNEDSSPEFGCDPWIPCIFGNVVHGNNGCTSVFTHIHQVNVVVAHPSKPVFASGSEGCTVMVYNLNGAVRSYFEGHEKGISCLSWSHDGSLLVSGSFDATIRIWDVESSLCLHLLSDHSADIQAVQCCPVSQKQGTRFLSGSVDQTLRIWDLIDDQAVCAKVLGDVSAVMSVCWSPNGLFFASATWDGLVRVWDAASLLQIFELKGHCQAVHGLSWSPDSLWLASGSRDASIRIWNVETSAQVAVLHHRMDSTRAVSSVLWSPCGRWLFDAARDFSIRQWCTASWTIVLTRNIHSESAMSLSAVPAAPPLILSSSRDCTVRLWNPELMVPNVENVQYKIRRIAWNPKSNTLLCGSSDGSIHGFDSSLLEFKSSALAEPFTNVSISCIACSADGKFVAVGLDNDHLCVHDLEVSSMRISSLFPRKNTPAIAVSFSADDVFIASGHADNTIRIWNSQSVQQVLELNGHNAWVLSVNWSPSSSNPMRLLSGSIDSTICVWEVWNDDSQTPLSMQFVEKLSGSFGTISCVCWSPDGLRLAGSSWDGLVRIWDATSLLQVFELKGHSDAVLTISWSSDGRWLASGSRDTNVCIWDVGQMSSFTKGPVLSLTGTGAQVIDVAFNACGKRIAACFGDFSVCVWYLTSLAHGGISAPNSHLAKTTIHSTCSRYDAFHHSLESSCIFARYTDSLVSTCDQCHLPILNKVCFAQHDVSFGEKRLRLFHESCLSSDKLTKGSRVHVEGFKANPAMNGRTGEIIAPFNVESGCWTVEVGAYGDEPSCNLDVKRDNFKTLLGSVVGPSVDCIPINLSNVHPALQNEIRERIHSHAVRVVDQRNCTPPSIQNAWWAFWSSDVLPDYVVRDLLFWNNLIYSPLESQTTLRSAAANLLVFGAPENCFNCLSKVRAAHMSWQCTGQFSKWSSCLVSFCPDVLSVQPPILPQSFRQHFPDFCFSFHQNCDSHRPTAFSSSQKWILEAYCGTDTDVDTALAAHAVDCLQKDQRYVSPHFSTAFYNLGVFHECSLDPTNHFIIVAHGRALTATLVFVDVFSNQNIFFKIQVVVWGIPALHDRNLILMPAPSNFKCYFVSVSGSVGQIHNFNVDVVEFKNIDEAISRFQTVYVEKTGIMWDEWQPFDKIECKYFHVVLEESKNLMQSSKFSHGAMPADGEESSFSISESVFFYSKYAVLLPTAASLVVDLFPLGPLSFQALSRAKNVLQELESCISNLQGRPKLQSISDLSNRFFSLYPRRFAGSVPLLSSGALLSLENQLIQQLIDSASHACPNCEFPPSNRFNMLGNFKAEYLDPSSVIFDSIAKCIKYSHSSFHSGWSMKVVDVLQVQHPVVNQQFEKWIHLSNHQLLWHGTRRTNVGGILQHGLKISPSSAPRAG